MGRGNPNHDPKTGEFSSGGGGGGGGFPGQHPDAAYAQHLIDQKARLDAADARRSSPVPTKHVHVGGGNVTSSASGQTFSGPAVAQVFMGRLASRVTRGDGPTTKEQADALMAKSVMNSPLAKAYERRDAAAKAAAQPHGAALRQFQRQVAKQERKRKKGY